MTISGITKDEFITWQDEIKHGFFLDNFSANPKLFSDKEIANKPILGNWTFNDFCLWVSDQSRDTKMNLEILNDKVNKQQQQIEKMQKLLETMSSMILKSESSNQQFKTNMSSNINSINNNLSCIIDNQNVIFSKIENETNCTSLQSLQTNSSTATNTINSSTLNIDTIDCNDLLETKLVTPDPSPTNKRHSTDSFDEPPAKKVCF